MVAASAINLDTNYSIDVDSGMALYNVSIYYCRWSTPSPNQLQDSVLLVSAVILVMNIYNLILIYQRAEKYRNLSPYAPRALLLAIVLIISIVLAWGQPKVVLIPSYLNIWVMIFIVLNCLQALLGQFLLSWNDRNHAEDLLQCIGQ